MAMMLEICVDDVAGLDAAIAGGADRVELCAALSLGGLSPAPSLIAAAARAPIPVHMLVRLRDGGFDHRPGDAAMLAADIDAAAQAGLAGVAIGATRDGGLDGALLAQLVEHARMLGVARHAPLSLTLHRAFDLCRDLAGALEEAVALGFDRVLTSGGVPRAPDGVATLAALHRRALGRIAILAGSGIDPATVTPILATGIREIHASCRAASNQDPVSARIEQDFGFARADRRETDVALVRALRNRIDQFASTALE